MFCRHCGTSLDDDAAFCAKCGKAVDSEPAAAQPQPAPAPAPAPDTATATATATQKGRGPFSKLAALLLAFFLGALGGHKFYEGKVGLGILYLFTAGLFGIGVLVDFIVICCKPDPYYL